MIEAKDKEQAVFELMRTFKLPGFERFNDVVPYVRNDDNKVAMAAMNKKARKSKKAADDDSPEPELIPEDGVGMGGPEGRVYWPPGMEEWLRPKKREVKKKEPVEQPGTLSKQEAEKAYAAREAQKAKAKKQKTDRVKEEEDDDSDEMATPATKKAKAAMKNKEQADKAKADAKTATQPNGKRSRTKKETTIPSPPSDHSEDLELDDDEEEPITAVTKRPSVGNRKASGRKVKKSVNYIEDEDAEMAEA